MRYVLDSSAAIQWLLPEKDSAKAIRLRDDYHNAIHELLAPDIFPAEMLSALTKAERTKRIGVGDAHSLSIHHSRHAYPASLSSVAGPGWRGCIPFPGSPL